MLHLCGVTSIQYGDKSPRAKSVFEGGLTLSEMVLQGKAMREYSFGSNMRQLDETIAALCPESIIERYFITGLLMV